MNEKEIENNVKQYLDDGLYKKGDYKHLAGFYLDTAKKSLLTANVLLRVSGVKGEKQNLGLDEDYESYLWVTTTSYYSMFYTVNALFSFEGIKAGARIAHKVSSDLFYYFFVKNNMVAAKLYEAYEEAKEDALELSHYSEMASKFSQDLENERRKMHKFQYNVLEPVKKSHAETSLKRVKEFLENIEIIIKNEN